MNALLIAAQIHPAWSTVREIRARVRDALSSESPAIRDAACMVSAELLENAAKYGESLPEAQHIDFTFEVKDGMIEVKVTNGAEDGENIQRLAQRIQELNQSEDSSALYISRLEELMRDPTQGAGLGISRIGFEGGFTLSVHYQSNVVAVIASRSLT